MYGKHGYDTRIVIYGVIHAVPAHEEHPAANSRAGGLVVRIIFLAIIRIAAEDFEHCADALEHDRELHAIVREIAEDTEELRA